MDFMMYYECMVFLIVIICTSVAIVNADTLMWRKANVNALKFFSNKYLITARYKVI